MVNAAIDVLYFYAPIYFSKYVVIKGVAVNCAELKSAMRESEFNA